MARLNREQLEKIKVENGVDKLYSWSSVHSFMISTYEYYLKKILHIDEDRQDSIYPITGGLAHDILEEYYEDKIQYEDMIDKFNEGWALTYDVAQLKFNRNDDENNKKIADKYYECLKHFFSNHVPLKTKPLIEKFITIWIGKSLLQGYIDVLMVDKNEDGENTYTIVDWKTSSIYKGDKANEESGQLVIYALGLNQRGIPLDRIKIGWNFLKYVSVQIEQKNGTLKTREIERNKIGSSLKANAKMWLKNFGYDIDEYIQMLEETNSIDCLPQEVKDKYIISDCYVYINLNQDIIDKWVKTISATIEDINVREKDYYKQLKETGVKNDKLFWDTDEQIKKSNYYLATLSGYSPKLHLPYKEYLEREERSKSGNDLFGGLGDNIPAEDTNSVSVNDVDFNSSEYDWLNFL